MSSVVSGIAKTNCIVGKAVDGTVQFSAVGSVAFAATKSI